MEERRVPFELLAFVRGLKRWRLEYTYDISVGKSDCWLSENPGIWGEGATLDEALRDMISIMRECAEICLSKPAEYDRDFLLLMLKVIFSSDEEILTCLDGKTCGDS